MPLEFWAEVLARHCKKGGEMLHQKPGIKYVLMKQQAGF